MTRQIKLPGYVLDKNGKLIRDPKDMDASARRKRQKVARKLREKRR